MRAWWLILLAGCSSDAFVESGSYEVLSVRGGDEVALDLTFEIDRVAEELRAGDASWALAATPKGDWVSGCPTNYTSVSLEVVVVEGPMALGGLTLAAPVLIAECFGGGVSLIDAFDPQIGGGGGCSYTEGVCVELVPARGGAPE